MLTELQFAQMNYDIARAEITKLDQEHLVAIATYQAKRKAAEDKMDVFNRRLNELERAQKAAVEKEEK